MGPTELWASQNMPSFDHVLKFFMVNHHGACMISKYGFLYYLWSFFSSFGAQQKFRPENLGQLVPSPTPVKYVHACVNVLPRVASKRRPKSTSTSCRENSVMEEEGEGEEREEGKLSGLAEDKEGEVREGLAEGLVPVSRLMGARKGGVS